MSIPDDSDSFWLDRWNALRGAIDDVLDECGDDTIFEDLLTRLCEFGKKQFYYFFLGFSHDLHHARRKALGKEAGFSKVQMLTKDNIYPPDYVLRSTINQIANDLEVIQRAYHQRQGEGDGALTKTLELVDAWGREILEKFSDPDQETYTQLLDRPAKVISYLTYFPQIRVIPYANVALVGIPLTATVPKRRRDLLVVPHELGHFVYRHGAIRNQLLHKKMPRLVPTDPPYLKNWTEELFADAFAMASTDYPRAMIHWALTMVKDNAPAKYWQDNRVHPINALRIYVYMDQIDAGTKLKEQANATRKMLTQMAKALPDRTGDHITDDVHALRESLQTVTGRFRKLILKKEPEGILEQEERLEIKKRLLNPELEITGIVDMSLLLSGLLSLKPFTGEGIETVLDILEFDVTVPDRWYEPFEQYVEGFAAKDNRRKPITNIEVRAPRFQTFRDKYHGHQPLACERWKVVFEANGWTTKGPQTGPTGAWEDPDWRDSGIHR